MPYPPSLGGAGLAEVAQTVRLSGRRIHLALRRCSQRPSMDRLALDFRQCSFRHVTRVSPSTGFSVFSPLSALPAGSCPLTLSSLGKPLTQGSPLNPSHSIIKFFALDRLLPWVVAVSTDPARDSALPHPFSLGQS